MQVNKRYQRFFLCLSMAFGLMLPVAVAAEPSASILNDTGGGGYRR